MSANLQYGYSQAVAITPSDVTNFAEGICLGIYVGGAGNITAIVNGAAVLFTTPAVGTVLLIRATRVNATGTTATGLVAMR